MEEFKLVVADSPLFEPEDLCIGGLYVGTELAPWNSIAEARIATTRKWTEVGAAVETSAKPAAQTSGANSRGSGDSYVERNNLTLLKKAGAPSEDHSNFAI